MNVVTGFLCAACIIAGASISATAQIKDGAIAPDFTVEDLNGQVHHLYEYLEQGKFVVLDFMSANCEPCWQYRESHQLEDFYAKHGPDGANDAVVLMIDSWITSNEQNLRGLKQPTYGDWLTGTPYPVIDLSEASSVVQAYDASTVPRVYRICPATGRAYYVHPMSSSGVIEEATVQGLEAFMAEQCGVAAAPEEPEGSITITTANGRIRASVPEGEACTMTLFTLAGDVVGEQRFEPGTSQKVMEAAGMASGIYLVRLVTAHGRAVARTVAIVH